MSAEQPILEIENLRTHFHTDDGIVKAVDGISLTAFPGETLGIVGESGSGKSVTSYTVMKLLPELTARVNADKVTFLGRDMLSVTTKDMSEIRGKDMAMIFQEPMSSLNPVFRVGDQLAEAIRFQGVSRRRPGSEPSRAFPTSERGHVPPPSGGQKQRGHRHGPVLQPHAPHRRPPRHST